MTADPTDPTEDTNGTTIDGTGTPDSPAPAWARYAEFVLWVAVVGGAVAAASAGVGYAVGGTLVAAKYALFVVGFLLFGAGSFAIQPTSPKRGGPRVSIEGSHQSGFEARIQELPPIRNVRLPFDRRIGRGAKLFVASLVVLGVSLLLEFGLGVRP